MSLYTDYNFPICQSTPLFTFQGTCECLGIEPSLTIHSNCEGSLITSSPRFLVVMDRDCSVVGRFEIFLLDLHIV